MARNIIAVIGSVTAEDYGPIRLILHHAGVKPKVVRIDLTDLCTTDGKYRVDYGALEQLTLEYNSTGPRDEDWERDDNSDAPSILIGGWLASKYPTVEAAGCVLVFRSSDFADPTSFDWLFTGVIDAWSIPRVDMDDRPSRSELESLLR